MENQNLDLTKKQAKKAAHIAGIATFLGFSIIMFDRRTYSGGMAVLIIMLYLGLMPTGVLASYLIGKAVYFLFIKNKHIRKIVVVILIIICYLLGIATFGLACLLFRIVTKTKPYTNQIDTNQDGKIDKWVYHDGVSSRAEIDTDYDGNPDIKEYRYNADLTKREYYKNGQLIKTEKFPIIKNKPR